MGVEGVDPGARETLGDERVQVGGDRDELRLAGALEGLAHETLVGAPGVEQGAPGLGAAGDGHRAHAR